MAGSKARLVVIGGGPKALALASKATVLRALGFSIPEMTIVEKRSIASHWDGLNGYTNGRQSLGTPPEKDMGFPYSSICWGDQWNGEVNLRMMEFSWQTYMIELRQFSDWVDRGRPAPSHRKWAEYMRWVRQKIGPSVRWVTDEVVGVDLTDEKQWSLVLKSGTALSADAIVATGPGDLSQGLKIPNDDRVFTLESFWRRLSDLDKLKPGTHMAVIGSGETAASMLVYLGNLNIDLKIDLIIPSAMSYSRGESYVENHVHSDPLKYNWSLWSQEDREKFIQRTDRGVFSLASKQQIDQWDFIEIIPGWFREMSVDGANQLIVELEYNSEIEHRTYDAVAISLGFDPWLQVENWLTPKAKAHIQKTLARETVTSDDIALSITEDLSIGKLAPRIHLPMLAGLKQGPGFPGLSCLGRLSDHLLQNYIDLGSNL